MARRAVVFAVVAGIALLFAGYTSHVWEDYYITYRSSHNLATGHGLVFEHGERLHTFTSPLGVLLPAAASVLTGNTSDLVALWLFRGLSILAFAGAATLLFATATTLRYPLIAAVALVAWLATDAKSVDFSINGMETGFLLLCFAYSFWALFAPRSASRRVWHLGIAWSGLMWCRPDSFIYIGLFFGAFLLFNRQAETGATRRDGCGSSCGRRWWRCCYICRGSSLPGITMDLRCRIRSLPRPGRRRLDRSRGF